MSNKTKNKQLIKSQNSHGIHEIRCKECRAEFDGAVTRVLPRLEISKNKKKFQNL